MDREKIAGITPEQIRAFRLRAHHLDRKLPPGALEAAASVCGFQNSPPGAWETALWNRVEGCTLQAAQDALYAKSVCCRRGACAARRSCSRRRNIWKRTS